MSRARLVLRLGLPTSLVVGAAVGCATAADDGALDLVVEDADSGASYALPPESSPPKTPGAPSADAGGSTKDAGASKADSGPKPPPVQPPPVQPPPQICQNEAGACWAAQTPCGCNADCCSGLTCDTVGALVEPWCCAPKGKACTTYNDCCGQLLCVDVDGGVGHCE